jgi:hypothetical protein
MNPTPTTMHDQSICYYHANAKGMGSALRLEPKVNRREGDRYNCFFIEMAAQKTAAVKDGATKKHATFDWENKITVRMDFADLCELLTVLEGRADKVGGERNGLYHASGNGNTLIAFQHNKETRTYFLSLSRKNKGDDSARKIAITLSEVEATGLRCLLQTGLFFVSFFAALMRERAA